MLSYESSANYESQTIICQITSTPRLLQSRIFLNDYTCLFWEKILNQVQEDERGILDE